MLRVSEMYLIKAELQAQKGQDDESMETLTQFRRNRGVTSTSISSPQKLLESEYCKEFFGEGQLFFYYKRLKRTSIPGSTGANVTVTLSSNDYVLPIPDGETQYN